MKMKPNTSEQLAAQIETAKAEIQRCETRAAELESAGAVDDKTIHELTGLIAKGRLLSGSVKRLEAEHHDTLVKELDTAIPVLLEKAQAERKAGLMMQQKLADAAAKILCGDIGSTPTWTAAFNDRRRHELLAFARQHPTVFEHNQAASRCDVQIDRNRQQLRDLRG